jgi:hypothetical protein
MKKKSNSCTQVLTVELNIIEIFIGITKAKKPLKDLVKVFNKDWAQLKGKNSEHTLNHAHDLFSQVLCTQSLQDCATKFHYLMTSALPI